MENLRRIFIGNTETTCRDLNLSNIPVRLERGGFFLCQNGHADIVIDLKQFHITKGDIIVVFPYSIMQVIRYSEDFDGSIIAADVNFSVQFKFQTSPLTIYLSKRIHVFL